MTRHLFETLVRSGVLRELVWSESTFQMEYPSRFCEQESVEPVKVDNAISRPTTFIGNPEEHLRSTRRCLSLVMARERRRIRSTRSSRSARRASCGFSWSLGLRGR